MRKCFAGFALLLTTHVLAVPLTSQQKVDIDSRIGAILGRTGVPSASIAIVVDGKVDYVRAYGDQRLDRSPASVAARYPIASISKQFTAAAILLLVEDGKMSLDDTVGKYLPSLTGADVVTVRELLSHTSGYRDYWPQDFAPVWMRTPVKPQAIAERWAGAPLDFVPGSTWQYSNTGYTIAGLIAEQVAHESLFAFEQRRIFRPLGMTVVQAPAGMSRDDARGTLRYALGPVRPASNDQAGWSFAAGDLALSPSELAKWNIARLRRTVLTRSSWQLQETNAAPADSRVVYGLGVHLDGGVHPRIRHGGAWTGFLSTNRVYPKDGAAVTVLTNAGFSNAPDAIADDIEAVMFGAPDDTATARTLFAMLARGEIDRQRFTQNGNDYFTATALADYRSSLGALGEPTSVVRYAPVSLRGGLTSEIFIYRFADRKLMGILRAEPDTGRVEQFTLFPFVE